ncbi:hypothetical protein SRHO_G00307570 [Serrasalmus rhombeus]
MVRKGELVKCGPQQIKSCVKLSFHEETGRRCSNGCVGASPFVDGWYWQLRVDLDKSLVFPPNIAVSSLRPDLVLWSNSCRRVYIIELTVSWEEAIDEAYERKRLRYSDHAAQEEERGWTVLVCPVEVGCRGFVANSTIRLLKEVGIRGQAQRRTIKELATTAERSSHWLWLRRKKMTWGAK